MKIEIRNGLPHVTVALFHDGQQLDLPDVLLDTGSAGSVFSADKLSLIGLAYEPADTVHRIRGVGGSEFVFTKQVDRIAMDGLHMDAFNIEVGALDYGMNISGILGTDFLVAVGAVIDLARLEVHQGVP